MKNVHEMDRTEVILELARHAHPTWYHSLLEWRTEQLKALLVYYREGGDFPTKMVGRIYKTKGLGDCQPKVEQIEVAFIEIDFTDRCACKLRWGHTGKHAPKV